MQTRQNVPSSRRVGTVHYGWRLLVHLQPESTNASSCPQQQTDNSGCNTRAGWGRPQYLHSQLVGQRSLLTLNTFIPATMISANYGDQPVQRVGGNTVDLAVSIRLLKLIA